MSDHVWTVSALNQYMKRVIDRDTQLSLLSVRGELSNCSKHQSGHCYFTLKDAGGKLRCVLFAKSAQHVRFPLIDGRSVVCVGHMSMYERDGQLQLYVQTMHEDGWGHLHIAFEQTKQSLQKQGLFDQSRKRPLPAHPRTVGVITSPTGAAVRDIMTTIARRHSAVHIVLYPVAVQGVHAVQSIVRALEIADECDVLIVGRGGGSIEELWAFNEEAVAQAIARARHPVIAAVGHESDVTIACLVADVRAATPTAAAELAVPEAAVLRAHVRTMRLRAQQAMVRYRETAKQRYAQWAHRPILRDAYRFLYAPHRERLERAWMRWNTSGKSTMATHVRRWQTLHQRLCTVRLHAVHSTCVQRHMAAHGAVHRAVQMMLHNRHQDVHRIQQQLRALSPYFVLQRGYGVVHKDGRLIAQVAQATVGDRITVTLMDGALDCTIKAVHARTDNS